MGIYLPENCLRKRSDCQPLSQIESDDEVSFVCCGLINEEDRTIEQDRFRLCWQNEFVSEIGDYDDKDMKDTISVMSQALSIDEHMRLAELEEDGS